MNIQLYIIVEGDTEERFVNDTIAPHLLLHRGICASASKVVTRGRRGQPGTQGGGRLYEHWRDDLQSWIKQQQRRPHTWFTTMLDLYGLAQFRDGFPGYAENSQVADPSEKVKALEMAWAVDISHQRFVPHLQLHEFEALLLADCRVLKAIFIEQADQVEELAKEISATGKPPESVNDGEFTAPSKRIIRHVPEYRPRKASAGPEAAAKIGLVTLRRSCPHFHAWLCRLENLTPS